MKEFDYLTLSNSGQLVVIGGKKYKLRSITDGRFGFISKVKTLDNWVNVGSISKPKYLNIFNKKSESLIEHWINN